MQPRLHVSLTVQASPSLHGVPGWSGPAGTPRQSLHEPSGMPQPQSPGAIFNGSAGHRSLQSAVPSLSLSVSATPQPQMPAAVFRGSFGQPSLQSAVPSPSLSVSATPQPQMPAAVFRGSFGHPSLQSAVPSLSLSVSATPQPQMPAAVFRGSEGHPSSSSQTLSPSLSMHDTLTDTSSMVRKWSLPLLLRSSQRSMISSPAGIVTEKVTLMPTVRLVALFPSSTAVPPECWGEVNEGAAGVHGPPTGSETTAPVCQDSSNECAAELLLSRHCSPVHVTVTPATVTPVLFFSRQPTYPFPVPALPVNAFEGA